MRRITQKDYEAGDCGIACAAMIAGCTYDSAHKKALNLGLLRPDKTYYTSHADLERLLLKLGVKCQRRRFASLREVAVPAIVKVNPSQGGKYWHWIVLTSRAGKYVLLDPNPDRPGRIESFRGYKGGGFYLSAA